MTLLLLGIRMTNKLVEEAPYHPGYEDAGFESKVNNEPVAWTDGRGNYFDKNSFFPVYDLIPLYTHPAKTLTDDPLVNFKPVWQEKPALTLTDEEINKLWAESHEDGIAMQKGFITQQHYFAWLILRKVQEK